MTKQNAGKIKTVPKFLIAVISLAVLILLVVLIAVHGNQPPVYTVKNDVLNISTDYGKSVNLSDVNNIQFKNALPSKLSKENGYSFGNVMKGKYSSSLGDISVYVDTSNPNYLYLSTKSGLIILNEQSQAKTKALYEQLKSIIKQ